MKSIKTKFKFENEIVRTEEAVPEVVSDLDDGQQLLNRVSTIERNASGIKIAEGDSGKFIFTNYAGQSVELQGGYLPDGETIILQTINGEDKLVSQSLKITSGTISGNDIFTALEKYKAMLIGNGAYADPIDFGVASPEENDITNYVLSNLHIATTGELKAGTKVVNNYDGRIWTYRNGHWYVSSNGIAISTATNSSYGLVIGDNSTPYFGKIEADGRISINNLSNLATQVSSNTANISTLFNTKQNAMSAGTQITLTNNGTTINVSDALLEANRIYRFEENNSVGE